MSGKAIDWNMIIRFAFILAILILVFTLGNNFLRTISGLAGLPALLAGLKGSRKSAEEHQKAIEDLDRRIEQVQGGIEKLRGDIDKSADEIDSLSRDIEEKKDELDKAKKHARLNQEKLKAMTPEELAQYVNTLPI